MTVKVNLPVEWDFSKPHYIGLMVEKGLEILWERPLASEEVEIIKTLDRTPWSYPIGKFGAGKFRTNFTIKTFDSVYSDFLVSGQSLTEVQLGLGHTLMDEMNSILEQHHQRIGKPWKRWYNYVALGVERPPSRIVSENKEAIDIYFQDKAFHMFSL
jgi:hypothetical protein